MKKLQVLHLRLIFFILFMVGAVATLFGVPDKSMIFIGILWIIFEILNTQRLLVSVHQVLIQIGEGLFKAKTDQPTLKRTQKK